jgi:hypothetical protein
LFAGNLKTIFICERQKSRTFPVNKREKICYQEVKQFGFRNTDFYGLLAGV